MYKQTTALATVNAEASLAIVSPKGKNYLVDCGGVSQQTLKRGVDFGVIPKTKKPSLYKSGAEKIAMGYHLLQHYTIESKIEQAGKEPLFYYLVRCDLCKVFNGVEYVWTSAFGSANTSEKRNGFNSPYDAANGTLKMAQKRALVAAALSISGLSDAFTQDMENEEFMQNAQALIDTDKPDSPVSAAQIKRLYAVGGEAGLNAAEVKQLLASLGYTSTKQILQKDYDRVIDEIKKKGDGA
jgi:hypothetical protein